MKKAENRAQFLEGTRREKFLKKPEQQWLEKQETDQTVQCPRRQQERLFFLQEVEPDQL